MTRLVDGLDPNDELYEDKRSRLCSCYVRHLREGIRFGLHYGVHNPTCPVYRVSRDPVDCVNDAAFREEVEMIASDVIEVYDAAGVHHQTGNRPG